MYIQTYLHTYMKAYIQTCIYVYTYTDVYIYECRNLYICACSIAYVNTYRHTNIHIYTYMYIYMYIYVYIKMLVIVHLCMIHASIHTHHLTNIHAICLLPGSVQEQRHVLHAVRSRGVPPHHLLSGALPVPPPTRQLIGTRHHSA